MSPVGDGAEHQREEVVWMRIGWETVGPLVVLLYFQVKMMGILHTEWRPSIVSAFVRVGKHSGRQEGVAVWTTVHGRPGLISRVSRWMDEGILTRDTRCGSKRAMKAARLH